MLKWSIGRKRVIVRFLVVYLLLLEDFRSSEFQELTKHRTTANDGTLSVDDESREFSGFVIIFKLC